MQAIADDELWDPEDADDCDDEADLFSSSPVAGGDFDGRDGLRKPNAGSAMTWDQVLPFF